MKEAFFCISTINLSTAYLLRSYKSRSLRILTMLLTIRLFLSKHIFFNISVYLRWSRLVGGAENWNMQRGAYALEMAHTCWDTCILCTKLHQNSKFLKTQVAPCQQHRVRGAPYKSKISSMKNFQRSLSGSVNNPFLSWFGTKSDGLIDHAINKIKQAILVKRIMMVAFCDLVFICT